ncbi:DUF6119 family protein [Treponema bryantii]|uniref:DUF6119 family protein n=1 Tax=Treponema bryantii TaxID=163 RepID=UPI002B2F22CC|nr:hypothetical protein TRBR_01690 [Treponema bryantii]
MAVQNFSIYLLKDGIIPEEDDQGNLKKIVKEYDKDDDKKHPNYINCTNNSTSLKSDNPNQYKLYINENPKSENNKWANYLDLIDIDEKLLFSVSPSCILLVPYQTRYFIICFGYAAFHIEKKYCVEDFGSITALNLIKKDKIKSLDAFSLTSSRKQRIQSTKEEDFVFFSADADESLIKNVSGSIDDEKSKISRIVGDCGVNVSTSVSVKEIENLIKYLYDSYCQKTAYLSTFPEFKNIFKEKEEKVIQQLQDNLIEEIKHNTNCKDTIIFSQPIIEDIYGDYSYYFNYQKFESKEFNKVTVEDLLAFISENKITIDKDLLKLKVKVRDNNETKTKLYFLEEVINFSTSIEVSNHTKNYYLFDGNWYYIDADYISRLNTFLERFICLDHAYLPDYSYTILNKNEDKFNKFCAKNNKDVCLLDKKLIQTDVSSIEAADLIYFPENEDKDKVYFIHNKLHTNSSTLNHLFNQGFASAKLFSNDSNKREALKKKIQSINKTITQKQLNRIDDFKNYGYVYGIIDEKVNSSETKKSSYIEYLPLLARIGLQKSIKDLIVLGANPEDIKVCFVNMTEIKSTDFCKNIPTGSSLYKNGIIFRNNAKCKIGKTKKYFLTSLNNGFFKALAFQKKDSDITTDKILVIKNSESKEILLLKVKSIKSVKYDSVNKIDVLSDTILNDKNVDKYFELWKAQVKKTLKNKNEDKIQLAEFEYVYPDFY